MAHSSPLDGYVDPATARVRVASCRVLMLLCTAQRWLGYSFRKRGCFDARAGEAPALVTSTTPFASPRVVAVMTQPWASEGELRRVGRLSALVTSLLQKCAIRSGAWCRVPFRSRSERTARSAALATRIDAA